VLQDFAKADRDWLDPLLRSIGRAAGKLASGDAAGFMNEVAIGLRPPIRQQTAKPQASDQVEVGQPAENRTPGPHDDEQMTELETRTGADSAQTQFHKVLNSLLNKFSRD
jgi:PTH1 family peptidyl-tRNA hydrolase